MSSTVEKKKVLKNKWVVDKYVIGGAVASLLFLIKFEAFTDNFTKQVWIMYCNSEEAS